MKKLLFILLITFCVTCKKDPGCDIPYPQAPYGASDDTLDLEYLEGRRVVIFVYNCLDGEGVITRYYQKDPCMEYEFLEIRGNCISPGLSDGFDR